jgi:hypothetical protein
MLLPLLVLSLFAQNIPQTEPLLRPAPQVQGDTANRTSLLDVSDLIQAEVPTLSPTETLRRTDSLAALAQLILDKLPSKAKQDCIRIEPGSAGNLLVQGGPNCWAFVDSFLETQRREDAPLAMTFHLFEAPHSLLAELGVEGSSTIFDGLEAYASALKQLENTHDVMSISTPRVAFGPRSSATISAVNQVAYVSDYELRIVEPGHYEILDPVIDVVEEGIIVDVSGVPMPGGVVDFDISVDYAQLARPIATLKTRFGAGDGHEVAVSLPEVAKVNIKALLSMQPGSAALIASAAPDEEHDFIVLVQFEHSRSRPSERVEALFSSMQSGTYAHRWFPTLVWSDIPALLAHAEETQTYTSFPTSPLSDLRPPAVVSGVTALWFIEGLREEGHCPSFAPLLVATDGELDASPTAQRALLARAAQSYRRWFHAFEKGNRFSGDVCPLDAVGLRWY